MTMVNEILLCKLWLRLSGQADPNPDVTLLILILASVAVSVAQVEDKGGNMWPPTCGCQGTSVNTVGNRPVPKGTSAYSTDDTHHY